MTDPTVGNWYGVTVSGGHVTEIALPSNNLVGDISDITLVELTSLILLDLGGNASLVDTPEYDATISGLRISAVDGTAFLDNCAAITGYADGAHLVRVYDSSNRLLTGVLAAQGSGETLGSNLIYNGDMELADGWDSYGEVGLITTSERSGDYTNSGLYSWHLVVGDVGNTTGIISQNVTITKGKLYRCSGASYNVSGGKPTFVRDDSRVLPVLFGQYGAYGEWITAYSYAVGLKDATDFKLRVTQTETSEAYIDDVQIKQVLTPSTSGATIADDTLTAKHADFAFNAASYRVQVKAL
jgi:hypothetical protein